MSDLSHEKLDEVETFYETWGDLMVKHSDYKKVAAALNQRESLLDKCWKIVNDSFEEPYIRIQQIIKVLRKRPLSTGDSDSALTGQK